MKVCHITSAHSQEDIRIFHKECVSLAKAGYETYLVSCGKDYEKNGVHLRGIGADETSRLKRMLRSSGRAYRKALEIDADIYHFHDPELLSYGLKLKKKGKKVIFDSHESVSAQIMDKTWIPKPLRKLVSSSYYRYETHVVKSLDAVVAATPHIAESFRERCRRVAVVNNYPRLDDIQFNESPLSARPANVCYAGGISDNRGEGIMIEAMNGVEGTLIIAGEHEVMNQGENIRYIGQIDREGINKLYGSSVAGLCLLKPIQNYFNSKPIKVYEYMAAGIPYVCSDFPDWRKVAEDSGAGICADPGKTDEIRNAIRFLLNNREKAQEMGRRGRQYVMQNCNWANEEKSLLTLYRTIENDLK